MKDVTNTAEDIQNDASMDDWRGKRRSLGCKEPRREESRKYPRKSRKEGGIIG